MKIAYLAVVVIVVATVAMLAYTTLPKQEQPTDKEIADLGNDLNAIDNLLGEFDSLGDLGLSEINDSLFQT